MLPLSLKQLKSGIKYFILLLYKLDFWPELYPEITGITLIFGLSLTVVRARNQLYRVGGMQSYWKTNSKYNLKPSM